jgi:predicted transcriptional regulator
MKETISFRIESERREKLDTLARQLETDRSTLIDDAIRVYLEFNAWFIKEVEKGLEEAEISNFASASEVEETFSRLTGE